MTRTCPCGQTFNVWGPGSRQRRCDACVASMRDARHRDKLRLGQQDSADNSDVTARYVPTPEQIRESCAEIQRTWTEADFVRRAGAGRALPVETEIVPVRALTT